MTESGIKLDFFRTSQGRALSLCLAMMFVGSVGLDQVSKAQAHKTLLVWEDGQDPELYRGSRAPVFVVGKKYPDPGVVPFYFQLQMQYSRNRGAAFSMLSNLPDNVRVPFFYGVTVIAVVLIGVYLRSTPFQQHLTRCGLILILSGAIGNFIDRVTRGYVVDFIDTEWNILGWRHDFAIFNVADVAINVGVICLVLEMITQWLKDRRAAAHTANEVPSP